MKLARGRITLFPGKIRGKPLTALLTPAHWLRLDAAAQRLRLTRSDLVGLLIASHAATVQLPLTLPIATEPGRQTRPRRR